MSPWAPYYQQHIQINEINSLIRVWGIRISCFRFLKEVEEGRGGGGFPGMARIRILERFYDFRPADPKESSNSPTGVMRICSEDKAWDILKGFSGIQFLPTTFSSSRAEEENPPGRLFPHSRLSGHFTAGPIVSLSARSSFDSHSIFFPLTFFPSFYFFKYFLILSFVS